MSGFRRLSQRELFAWSKFSLVEGEFESPAGERFTRTYLDHPGAVGIVPIDGDEFLLVRQYRAPLDRDMLEIPAGTLDKGDAETLEECATRELAEEIGATAATLEHLMSYAVAVGSSSEMLHLFVARGLTLGAPAPEGVEEQAMTVERLAFRDVESAIAGGRIEDAKTMIGLLLARGVLPGRES